MKRSDLVNLVESRKGSFLDLEVDYGADRSECLSLVFDGSAECIASYWEGDYQGVCAWAYRFDDGSVLLISDYFGSCSGCDSFQAAETADEAYELTRDMVFNGHLCKSVKSAISWIRKDAQSDKYSSSSAFSELIAALALEKKNG